MSVLLWMLPSVGYAIAIFALSTLLLVAKEERRGFYLGAACAGVLVVTSIVRCYCEIEGFAHFAGDTPTSTSGVVAFMLTVGLTTILLPMSAALYAVSTELKNRVNVRALHTVGISLLLAWAGLFANMLNFSYATGPSASSTLNTISAIGGIAALGLMIKLKVEAKIRRAKAAKV